MRYPTTLPFGKLALTLSMVIFLFSCAKDNDEKNTDFRLSSYTIIEIDEDPYLGTDYDTTIYNLTYDAEGKLITIDDDYGYTTKFIYNNSGTLEKIEEYSSVHLRYYYLLTWLGNQVTIQEWLSVSGTFVPWFEKKVYYFTGTDQIDKIEMYQLDDNEQWILKYYKVYTWQNNNNTIINSYIEDPVMAYSVNQTFDSKPNPFYNLQPYWFIMDDFLFISKNNITSISNDEQILNFIFTYNDNNYPATIYTEFTSDGNLGSFEWKFEYESY